MIEGYIFGSKPPDNDSFWDAYGTQGRCKVITCDRHFGKEKEIDTGICVKMVTTCYQIKGGKQDLKHTVMI